MTYRKLLWTGVVVLLAGAIAGLFGSRGNLKLSLSQSEVQERINKQIDRDFPIRGSAGLLVKSASLKGVTVTFEEGHALISFDLEGTLRTGRTFSITASAIGQPLYSGGAFYFKPENLSVDSLTYEGSTPAEAVDKFTQRHIRSERLRGMIHVKAYSVEQWATTLAEHAATKALLSKPIYRPRDDVKGYLIGATFESVDTIEDHLVITLSLWQLTLQVLVGLMCLIAAVALAFALLEYRLLGLALLFS